MLETAPGKIIPTYVKVCNAPTIPLDTYNPSYYNTKAKQNTIDSSSYCKSSEIMGPFMFQFSKFND